MRRGRPQPEYPELSLWRKCVCVLLAYSILMGPGVSEALAVDSTLYTNLCAGTWGADNTTILYEYDENGSVVEKRTITTGSSPEDVISRTGYVYDLAGQLYEVRELSADGSTVISWTRYSYNDDGIRIRSEDSSGLVKTFLIDPANGTGYAQVLEEYDGTTRTSYTIGDDVLAQKAGSAQPQYLLYDGHGSTRQLADSAGAVAESYTYDAYGMAIGFNPATAATNLLYTGEQYDSSLSQYYLRARYYNPSDGRFTQTDPFEGNSDDPQSLHKYTYCHNDPVNAIDPSGCSPNLTEVNIVQAIGRWTQAVSMRLMQILAQKAFFLVHYLACAQIWLLNNAVKIEFWGNVGALVLGAVDEGLSHFERNLMSNTTPITTTNNFERGFQIEDIAGVNLGPTFAAIDDFRDGVATQLRSHSLDSQDDLLYAIVRDARGLQGIENRYLSGYNRAGQFVQIGAGTIRTKQLLVAIPQNQAVWLRSQEFRRALAEVSRQTRTVIRVVPVARWQRR